MTAIGPIETKTNSIITLLSNGQIQAALDSALTLMKDYPKDSMLLNITGACYAGLDQLNDAVDYYERAISIKPDYAKAFYNLAGALQELGRLDESVKNYQKSLLIEPNHAEAHNNLGNVYIELGNLEDAVKSFEQAIANKPDYVEAYYSLGISLQDLGRLEEAIENYLEVLNIKPEFAEMHNNLGVVLQDIDQIDNAVSHLKKAIEIKPDFAEAHNNLANIFLDINQPNEAIKFYENAIFYNPFYAEAYYNLSAINQYSMNDEQIEQMQLLFLSRDNLSQSELIFICFALAKIFENKVNQNEFFDYLHEGNRLRKKQLNYSFDKDKKLFSEIRQVFKTPPPILKESSLDASLKRPIFIVGMPRSGTSLVEQILSSHQEVHGAGELEILTKLSYPVMQQYIINNESVLSEKVVSTIRQGYLDFLDTLEVSEKIITDKMPLNFRFIGFILSAFPEAKIVHMKRDSMATCWSIYQFYFRGSGNGFGYNLKDLASYYHLYLELMDFWHGLFPNQIYDMCYEDLTTNQEEETRNLLKYCELEWDKNCLNFQNNKRSVKTASTLQVREKMYQGSSEAWKKYEAYLKPLINGLN